MPDTTLSNVTAAALSQVLYQQDPMNTCCVENDCTDEYDGVAAAVIDLAAQGTPLQAALSQVLVEYFGAEPERADAVARDAITALPQR